jgi:cation diffusion facilitator family transporter
MIAASSSRVTEPAAASFSAEKQRVARRSMAAAAAMTLLKVAAGLLSGSLGVLSDAAHSGLDLVGAALTYFSVHVSDKPADEDHTYGHGKIENLSAFSEAGLMALSSAWIIWEAVERIFYHAVELHHSLWPALVLVTSIGVDIWRSRQLRAVALRTGSPALATDAFRTSGRHQRCWRGWARRGWVSDSKLRRCAMPIRWRLWWCR